MKPKIIHLVHLFIFKNNINIILPELQLIIIVLQWRLYTCIILFESIFSHKHFFKYLGLTHKNYYLERNVHFGLKLFENFQLVLHEEFKANIHLTSKNSLKTKIFYALPLSLKILLNLCSFLIVNKKQLAKYWNQEKFKPLN